MPLDLPDACAVVPCRNEARTIGAVVTGLRSAGWPCLVVDDGSSDATATTARAAGAEHVLQRTSGHGKGAALRAGWEHAARLGATWVLLLDGDGQHDPAEASRFVDAVRQDPGLELVIGNRMADAHRMPWVRRWTNRWMSARLSRAAGVPLPDSQCGYRLARVSLLTSLDLRTGHFEIESEMVIAAARHGARLGFVPISVRYGTERSKIVPWTDTRRWWRWYRNL